MTPRTAPAINSATDAAAEAAIDPPWVLRYFWPLLGALVLLRLLLNSWFVLVPDEAVYWSWSRHLALSYFDHPPMVAWLAWLSTRLLGNTELAVRLPATLLAYGTVVVIVWLGRRIVPDSTALAYLAIMWLVSPLLIGFATIATPDTPAIFFSTCALGCGLLIAVPDDEDAGRGIAPAHRATARPLLWVLLGVFVGLALLAKYTTVLLPVALVLWALSSRRGRAHLLGPWPYLAMLIALVLFSPVLWWNYRHGWASFLYQLHHGAGGASGGGDETPAAGRWWQPFWNFATFVGGQAVLWTPILFGIAVFVLVRGWKRFRSLTDVDRLLLLAGSMPLLLFGFTWVRKPGEMNWPAFAYVPLSFMAARLMADKGFAGRVSLGHWMREGCKMAFGFAVGLHVLLLPGLPRLAAKVHLKLPHNVTDLRNEWPQLGPQIAQHAAGSLVVCNRHQDAAEAAFYTPGQPDVWCDGVGSRPTAYDYFDTRPNFAEIDRVLFIGGHANEFLAKRGYIHWEPFTLRGTGPAPRTARPAGIASR